MSVVIKLRTKAALVNQEKVRDTLELLRQKLSGFSYSEWGSTISINYPPIDVFHKSGNLKLEWNGERYVITGDPYNCKAELNKVLALIQVGYNYNTAQAFYTEHKMTEVKTEKVEGGIIKISGVIEEKNLVPVKV